MNIQDMPLHFPEVWDDTMRREYATCPTKWAYSNLFHAGLPGKNIHLESGGALASGLDVARTLYYEKFADPTTAVNQGFAQILREWDSEVLPVNSDDGDQKNLISVSGAYASYFERYPLDTDPIRAYITEDGKAGVEFNFAIPIDVLHPVTGQPIIYAGRFDLLGVFNDKLWVVDEKTTSRLGPTWGKQWRLRSQFTGYCWGARQYNLPVVGAIVRGISILSGGFGHEEVIVYRPDYLVEQWYEQLLQEIEEAKLIYLRIADNRRAKKLLTRGIKRANGEGCMQYNSACIYMQLCESRDPISWIPSNYIHHTWNPIERKQTDINYTTHLESLDANNIPVGAE